MFSRSALFVGTLSLLFMLAVLEHERYHVRNLDPLKVMLARGVPAMFFYLPC